MEIRSVNRASYLALEHEFASCSTGPEYSVPVSVSQSAHGFTGTTGKNGFVCISLQDINDFIYSLEILKDTDEEASEVLHSLNINKHNLELEIFKVSDGAYILKSTLTRSYECLKNDECELVSVVSFKIKEWAIQDLISGLEEMY